MRFVRTGRRLLTRATSLIGAAGNVASAAAESESTPMFWPAAIVSGTNRQPRGRVGHGHGDRAAVTLALTRHADRGRATSGDADLRIVDQKLKVGKERFDHDPVGKANAAPVFEVANHQRDLVRAARYGELERRVGETIRTAAARSWAAGCSTGVVGVGQSPRRRCQAREARRRVPSRCS